MAMPDAIHLRESPARPNFELMIQISVKLVIVPQRDVCNGPYRPGPRYDLTRDAANKLARRNTVSSIYKLSSGKTTPLELERQFQQALIPAIRAGEYAVLLEFDWGGDLRVVVDLVPGPTQTLPEWSKNPPKYVGPGRYWYAHRNAGDFDPAQSATWQVTVNGPTGSTFLFYTVPA
jgi:hypothetical protein